MGRFKVFEKCSIPECDKPYRATGFCQMHRSRWLRALNGAQQRKSPEQRFWSRVEKRDPTECWLWQGALTHGYGRLSFAGRRRPAHCVAYFLHYGFWPEPLGRHVCDTPQCVNPMHVLPGTHQDNMDDRTRRGRNRLCGRGRNT